MRITRGWLGALVMGAALPAACAVEPVRSGEDPGENVILVTLDGVRSQEVFGRPEASLTGGDAAPAFPLLLASAATDGVIYGNPATFDVMTTTNDSQVSLPGYMSIFAGFEQRCYDNDCPQTAVETVLERIQRARGFERGEVAAFASWARLGRALQQVPGEIWTDIGPQPGDTGYQDPTALPPWENHRWDRDTFPRAMRYLEKERPRLLYISLGDGDGWAHEADYPRYLATLRQYDVWIDELRRRLAGLGEYGARTTLIVTTDHGRGDGELWTDHNSDSPGSERIFLYAIGPHVRAGVARPSPSRRSHADVRPTLETLFGVAPRTCARCGTPLAGLVAAEVRP